MKLKAFGITALFASTSMASVAESQTTSAETTPAVTTSQDAGTHQHHAEAVIASTSASTPAATVATVPLPPALSLPLGFKFELHGFVSGTLFVQDGQYAGASGPDSVRLAVPGANNPWTDTDRLTFSGDVRQSRFNFSVTGTKKVLRGATPKAVLEIDFLGGDASGSYGAISVLPRLRLAYAELKWDSTTLVVGQNYDLTALPGPTSLAHRTTSYSGGAFPGWRRPGVFGYHFLGDKAGWNYEVDWELGRAAWYDGNAVGAYTTTTGTASSTSATGDAYGNNYGEASGVPAVEARVGVAHDKDLLVQLAGHWNSVDRSGVGSTDTSRDLQTTYVGAFAKALLGPVTLQLSGFTGKNLAGTYGGFAQFQANNVNTDVHGTGGWAQVGYNFTPELSLWGAAALDALDEDEAIAANFTTLRNQNLAAVLLYKENGIGFSVEYLHTTTRVRPTSSTVSADLDGNQLLFTGLYDF